MADILDLPGARKAIRAIAADTSMNADLTAVYIPAVTEIVESLAGPQTSSTGHTWAADGGSASVQLPSAATAVTAVTENGLPLTADQDYYVDLEAGIVYRGTTKVPFQFIGGRLNIVVTYDTAVTPTPKIILAARIILAHLYWADQQGARQDFGATDTDLVETPVGYLIPRRAYNMLVGEDVSGFA